MNKVVKVVSSESPRGARCSTKRKADCEKCPIFTKRGNLTAEGRELLKEFRFIHWQHDELIKMVNRVSDRVDEVKREFPK